MRVLQIHTPYRREGGEDKVVRDEAIQLRRGGHEVVQYCVPNPQGRVATLGALAFAPWNPAASHEVKMLVKKLRPDLAHVHNTWFRLSPSVPQMVHDLGVPVTMTLHNYRLLCLNALLLRDGRVCEDCVGKHPWRGVLHRCYRDSASLSTIAATTLTMGRLRHTWDRAVDRFIAPSAFAASKAALGGIPAEKIMVKSHGVADPGPRSISPSQSHVVLFVGRLSHEKGASSLLDAWATASVAGLNLTVVGDGPLRRALEERQVPGVTFLGWRRPDEVQSLMLSARALVFPSICYEGLPYAVIEALAAGLPVMASGLGSVGDILEQLGRDWLASQPIGSDWAPALGRLSSGDTIDTAGRRARQLYGANYTIERSADRLLKIYAESIRAAGRP